MKVAGAHGGPDRPVQTKITASRAHRPRFLGPHVAQPRKATQQRAHRAETDYLGPARQRLSRSSGSPPQAFFSVVPHHRNKQNRFNCFPSDAARAYGHTDSLVSNPQLLAGDLMAAAGAPPPRALAAEPRRAPLAVGLAPPRQGARARASRPRQVRLLLSWFR